MSRDQFVEEFETTFLGKKRPIFKVGDTVKVHTKIIEGQKERIQAFTGIVIARKGSKLSETFTVYRNAYGRSMERVFLLHSPRVIKIEVERSGDIRKAKLYHIRGETGKKAKVKEKIGGLNKKQKIEMEEKKENIEPKSLFEEKPEVEVKEEIKKEEPKKKE